MGARMDIRQSVHKNKALTIKMEKLEHGMEIQTQRLLCEFRQIRCKLYEHFENNLK